MAEPRVIIAISSFYPIVGGAERQAQNLARVLAARGIDVRIVTRAYPGAPARETIDGVEVVRLPAPGPKFLKLPVLFLAHARYFRQRRGTFDIVHIFQLDAHATFATLLKPLMGRVQLMVKMANLGPWGEMHRLRGPVGKLRLALFRRRLALLTGTCDDVVAELTAAGFAPRQIGIIPTGIDTERYRPPSPAAKARMRQQVDLPADAPVAVFTGRLTAQKGVDVLLRAWQQVEQRVPAAHLLILGGGSEEQALKNLQAQLGLRRARFCGLQAEVQPWLHAADVFVFPSRADGLSNSFLEALACGLVPVATGYGGARAIIRDSENGFLVGIDDANALADRLAAALTHPDRAAMAQRVRDDVVAYASLPQVAEKYLTEYRRLCASTPR